MFVISIVCWWMFLDCFTCISSIFEAINFVRWAYESLDFEDSKNMWLFPKNVDLGWETAKTKKGVKNSVLACSHRKTKKYRSKWKFTCLKILYLNSPIFSDMIVFLVYEKMSEKTDFTAKTKFFVPSFSTFFDRCPWIVLPVSPLFSKLSTSFVKHMKA